MPAPARVRRAARFPASAVEVDLRPGRPRERRQAGRGEALLDRSGRGDVRQAGAPSPSRTAKPRRLPGLFRSASPASRFRTERDGVRQVRGEQARVAQPIPQGLSGGAVEVDAEPRGRSRLEALREQRPDHAGQDVAGPAARQRRILERGHGHRPVGLGDDRLRALEDDDLTPRLGGGLRGDAARIVVGRQVAVASSLPRRSRRAAVRTRPMCGVSTHARTAPVHHSPIVAIDRSASASRTRGAASGSWSGAARSRRTSSAVARPGRNPGPTTIASCSWSRIRAIDGSGSTSSTSSSGSAIVVASTTFAANSGCRDSGIASVTRPAPARPAARQTSSAAPA